jgi:hypothetical protein
LPIKVFKDTVKINETTILILAIPRLQGHIWPYLQIPIDQGSIKIQDKKNRIKKFDQD